MTHRKILAIVLAAMMLMSLLAGCGSSSGNTPAAPAAEPAAPAAPASQGSTAPVEGPTANTGDLAGKTIALSSQHLGNQFNQGVLSGVTEQAKKYNFKLVTANAQSDTAQQVADLENFVAMGVDAIIIGGGEGAAFENVMKEMDEKGITCITVDMSSAYADANITSDNFNGGEQMCLAVKNMINGQGNVLICTTPGWTSLEIRDTMLESIVKFNSGLKIVDTISLSTEDAVNNYQKEVKAYLQGNPDIQWIFCDWGLAAVGSAQAVRELGMQDQVIISCVDADQVVLEEMKREDSPLKVVVGQYPDMLGAGAVDLAATALSGGVLPTEAYAPIILIAKDSPESWFSAPAIMTAEEAWAVLYGGGNAAGESAVDAAGTALGDLAGKTIALSSQHLGNQFNQGVLSGVTEQAKKYNFKLVTANAQSDTAQQVADLENFVAMGVDAIIIGGGEGAAFENVMKEMDEKGITCITVDMSSAYADANITSDNFNGGEQMCLAVKNMINGQGNVLICTTPGWTSLEIRDTMLESIVKFNSGLKIVDTISLSTEDAVNNYQKEVKAYLQGNPDIQWIFCDWGLAAVGSAQAVRELGMQDQVIISCVDADQVVLEEMKREDSPLKVVVGQYPDMLGAGAVDLAATALSGGVLPTEAYAPIILIAKTNPSSWFSAPAIMTVDEAWATLYPGA